MKTMLLLIVSCLIAHAYGQFNPVLEVSSCTQSQLVITLTGASDTGTVYIQGRTAACQQTTSATGTVTHTFLFSSCGLQWEESFKIIVQKHSLYQTGDDKQIPVMCITDLSDIEVTNNLNALDKDDDAGKNLTVKPTATMTLYSNGVDVGGGNVKLTDALTMGLQLGAEFVSDFDILASACTASGIPIIADSCAPDTVLFPNFDKPFQGYLAATFGAFRTTSLDGGSVAMTFSCTLKVCLGSCTPAACANGENGYGRKKRSLVKRQAAADNNEIEEINVGATLKITTESVVLENPEEENEVCMEKAVFIVATLAVMTALVASAVTALTFVKKSRANADALRKLDPSGLTSVSLS